MASIFCPHCGSKAEYNFSPPNFCYKCGMSYNGLTATVQKHKKTSRLRNVRDDEEEEFIEQDDDHSEGSEESYFSNSTRVPRLSRISVDIDSSSDVRVVKFSDLMSSNYESKFPKGKTQNLSDLTND